MKKNNSLSQQTNQNFTNSCIVIGISGPSGSGKTTVCNMLQKLLSDCVVLQQDLYFKPGDALSDLDNFCDFKCLNLNEFVQDVITLTNGGIIKLPNIDLNTFEQTNVHKTLVASKFILIEGMTIFRVPEIYWLFDFRYYISPGIEEIRFRKISRDLNIRRKTLGDINYQLSWVEQEYNRDVQDLPSEVTFISGKFSAEQICRKIFKQIAKHCCPISHH